MSVNVESDVKCVCRSLFFAFPLLSLLRFTLFSFSLIHLAFNHSSFFPTFFSFLLFTSSPFSSPLLLFTSIHCLLSHSGLATFPSSFLTLFVLPPFPHFLLLPPPFLLLFLPNFPMGRLPCHQEDGTKAIAFFVILFVFIFFLV